MEFIFIFLILPLLIAALVAFFIARATRRQLEKHVNPRAKVFSILTFVFSFLVVAFAIFALIAYNIRFER